MKKKKPKPDSELKNDTHFRDLIANIQDVITRPQTSQITVKQAYAIMRSFTDAFLTEEQRALPSAEQQEALKPLANHAFAQSDRAIGYLVQTLAIGARAYAENEVPDYAPLSSLLDETQSHRLIAAWSTMESAQQSEDATVQKIGAALEQAFRSTLPQNQSVLRRINRGGSNERSK